MPAPSSSPARPPWALLGLPPAADLPTREARQRYAHAVLCALADTPSWTVETWRREGCPLDLRLRAADEDWPMLGTSSVVAILRPAPLPASAALAPVAALPADLQAEARAILGALVQGEAAPAPASAALAAALAAAIRHAAQAGYAAAMGAAEAAA
ncbi:MAG: hypothetical protein R3F60_27025 [bacterium]